MKSKLCIIYCLLLNWFILLKKRSPRRVSIIWRTTILSYAPVRRYSCYALSIYESEVWCLHRGLESSRLLRHHPGKKEVKKNENFSCCCWYFFHLMVKNIAVLNVKRGKDWTKFVRKQWPSVCLLKTKWNILIIKWNNSFNLTLSVITRKKKNDHFRKQRKARLVSIQGRVQSNSEAPPKPITKRGTTMKNSLIDT